MHITDNFSLLTTLLLAFGGVLFVCGFVFAGMSLFHDQPTKSSFRTPATVAVVGLIVAISGWAWNSSSTDDLNRQFASQLQDQYGASSDKSYSELFQSRDRITTLTKGDEKKQVQVIFEKNGDLKFADISSTPYK